MKDITKIGPENMLTNWIYQSDWEETSKRVNNSKVSNLDGYIRWELIMSGGLFISETDESYHQNWSSKHINNLIQLPSQIEKKQAKKKRE